jgi:hypothetical protein
VPSRRKWFILRSGIVPDSLRLSTQTDFGRGRFWAVVAQVVTSPNDVR